MTIVDPCSNHLNLNLMVLETVVNDNTKWPYVGVAGFLKKENHNRNG